ncbi:MAG: multidrug effflux MFS transporter [Agriterribacter sp.]
MEIIVQHGQQYNNATVHTFSKKQRFFLILMLGALNTITPFSIDMYLPGFKQIATELDTTSAKVALSVSSYFLGFALGQIIYGPLLDRFGRKRPMYIGLTLYILATLACISSQNLNMLLFYRFIQALGGCVSSVAAMAMVSDFFHAKESAKIISLLVLILGVSPLLAPTVGGFIVSGLGWHWVFVSLAVIVLLILLLTFFFLPEGHQPDPSVDLRPKPIINGFKNILLDPRFYIFSLAGTFSFAGLFVYVAGSPAIFMDGFHLSAKAYGGVFALLSVGFIGGSQLNHILTRRFSNQDILLTVIVFQVLTAAVYFTGVLNDWYELTGNIIFLFLLLLCVGLTYPNAASVAMAPFSKNAGSASALLGFIQIGVGGIISSGVGMFGNKGSLSTSLIMLLSSGIALIILLIGKKFILVNTNN